MPNVFFHHYKMDQSISVLRVVGWYFFIFIRNSIERVCKQTVEALIRSRVRLWVLTVCLCTTKRSLCFNGLVSALNKVGIVVTRGSRGMRTGLIRHLHTLCMRAAKALPAEPSLLDNSINTEIPSTDQNNYGQS